ncbi:hypothetical protein FQA39_LY16107 [Lamprigera yunnana]|nr:hypothetical protein FQA39_LY16107 [Lamprigera yunnana]
MNVVFYILLLVCSSVTPFEKLCHQLEEDNLFQHCISNFIEYTFNKNYPIYYVSDNYSSFLVPRSDKFAYVIFNTSLPIYGALNDPGYFILHAKNVVTLTEVMDKLITSTIWNKDFSPGAKFLILTSSTEVADVFEFMWEKDIVRVYVILSNEVPVIYTSNPYEKENECGRLSKVKHLTDCILDTVSIIPIKMRYEDCSAVYKMEDIMEIQDENPEIGARNFILETFGHYVHTNVQYVDESTVFLMNYNIVFETVTYCSPTSEQIFINNFGWITFINQVSSVNTLQHIFEMRVWIIIAVSFLATSLIWCLIINITANRCDVSTSLINVWALTMLGCILKVPKQRSIKTLLLLYLVFIIVIHTAFKTNLARVLSVDHYETFVDNIKDLANTDRDLCAHETFFEYFNKTADSDITYTKVRNKIIWFREWNDVLINKNCTYLMYSKDINGLHSMTTSRFKYFTDHSLIGNSKTYLLITRGHKFKKILQNLILSLNENGIFAHNLLANNKIGNRSNEESEEATKLKVLTLNHVSGIFAVFIRDLPIYYISNGASPLLPKNDQNQYVLIDIYKDIEQSLTDPGYYILHTANEVDLENFVNNLSVSNVWNSDFSTGTIYLIITDTNNVSSIFKTLWNLYLLRAAVIFHDEDYPKIYTSNPFDLDNNCMGQCKVHHSTSCTSDKIVLPNTNKNLQNCWIAFKTHYTDDDDGDVENIIIKSFLELLKNYLNVSIDFISPLSHRKYVNDYSAVLQVGTSKVSGDLDMSDSIFIDNFGWVTPLNEVPSINVLQYVFEKRVWIMIGMSILATAIAWGLLVVFTRRRLSVSTLFVNIWSLTMLGCLVRLPKLQYLRILILFYLLFVIVIHTAFKTNLAQILSIDHYERVANNLNDLIHSEVNICVHEVFQKFYFAEDNDSYPLYAKLKQKMVSILSWEDVTKNKNCSFLMLYQDINFLKQIPDFKMKYFIDNTLTGNYRLHFLLEKEHFFKNILNDGIKRLMENGIYENMVQKGNKKVYGTKRNDNINGNVEPLAVGHMYSVFVVWATGMVVSILVFISEIIYKKLEKEEQ